jgi:ATP adenylyltransferase
MKIDQHMIIPGKLAYVRGKKPEVDCILCALRDSDKRVPDLVVLRHELMIVTLNLYPYNPGHLMIFPRRHLTDIRQFTQEEVLVMHRLQERSMHALEALYNPRGFNIGFNVGQASGASIEHIHCHVIPRHRNEIGMVEMISQGSRVLVEDPMETRGKLRAVLDETEE